MTIRKELALLRKTGLHLNSSHPSCPESGPQPRLPSVPGGDGDISSRGCRKIRQNPSRKNRLGFQHTSEAP